MLLAQSLISRYRNILFGKNKVRERQGSRVCLLMSGRPSVYQSALQMLSKQLRPLGNERISLYALFWDPVTEEVSQKLHAAFDDVHLWGASAGDFSHIQFANKPEETNAGNFLSMQSGRQLLLEQLKVSSDFDASQFDVFCYTRPDVCLNDQISADLFTNLADSAVYVPKNGHWRNGVNDQFVLGRYAALQAYLSLYSKISHYYSCDHVTLHPEQMLAHHLRVNHLNVNKLPCDNVIFRSEFKFGIG